MSCKFASSSSAKQSLNLFSKSKLPPTKHIPDSISFTSHVTKSRIFITNRQPAGPLRASIKALYEPTESLYELLGVAESGSTVSDIKKAYKKMARKYHPDVSPPDRVDEHTRKFIMVKEAYETLSNPQRRALYDTELLAQGLEFGFSSQYHQEQRMEEKWEWRTRWQSRLDELKSKNKNPSRGRMSWGARMRAQR